MRNTELLFQASFQLTMVHGVECGTEVQQNQEHTLLPIQYIVSVIVSAISCHNCKCTEQ